jgi:chaperone BCS1
MSTNHPEILDSALIRPGRIDCKFLFDNCDSEQIGKLYEMFFNQEMSELNKLQLELLSSKKNYSPAHITSIFLRYRNNPEVVLEHLDEDDNTNFDCNGDMNVPGIYKQL